jgi:hypothetical protein
MQHAVQPLVQTGGACKAGAVQVTAVSSRRACNAQNSRECCIYAAVRDESVQAEHLMIEYADPRFLYVGQVSKLQGNKSSTVLYVLTQQLEKGTATVTAPTAQCTKNLYVQHSGNCAQQHGRSRIQPCLVTQPRPTCCSDADLISTAPPAVPNSRAGLLLHSFDSWSKREPSSPPPAQQRHSDAKGATRKKGLWENDPDLDDRIM